MYYLAYNPTKGNCLVALSNTDIPADDGITVQTRQGDMPDLSRYCWNTAILDWYEKPHKRLTKLEYMNRFTDQELALIYSAAKVNVQIEVWLAKFNATSTDDKGTSIDLEDPRTIAGIQALEAAGIINTGRANEILI